ncbi:unnamed protein product [Caenorhabditis sp. 36 PRJEB53466]|nr:unnamed protein product [Caenorhabditis sp. 36 PRJEB53466]
MSNNADSTIFTKMTSRAAGKRRVKPTSVLYATLNDNNSSDEEDDDFEVKPDETCVKTETSDSESGSSNGLSDQDVSDEEDSEEEENEEENGVENEEEKRRTPSADKELVVCGVCVNARDAVAAGDFMQCDKCGIHVHESCYGGLRHDDPEETRWFCEPCQMGLTDPPHCEFCPSRLGAFKRAEIPGRWCHVVCALFTHGVVFTQADTLTGISWELLENSLFGKRTCSACSDKIEARFGIAPRCESGMCKEYLHVTCAQKLGLLVDETDDHESADAIAVMRYFFCKKHTNHDNLKPLQKRWAAWEKAESRRMTVNRRRKPLDEDEKKLREAMREKLEKTLFAEQELSRAQAQRGEDRQKQARLLNTSAEYFDRFETKAEDVGITREEFRDPFFNIKLANTSHIPIGFSKEYIDFMALRDSQIIPEEEEKLRKVREMLAETKQKHEKMAASKQLSERFEENDGLIEHKLATLHRLSRVLVELQEKNDDFSELLAEFVDVSARKSAERTRGSPSASGKVEYACAICEQTTEQHKQTQCDECHKSYHIGCLTPPLTRLPKRNNFGWICHVCNESDESDEEILETTYDDSAPSTRSSRSRRPPARLSAFDNQ